MSETCLSQDAQRRVTRLLLFLDGCFPLPLEYEEMERRAASLPENDFLALDARIASELFRLLRRQSQLLGIPNSVRLEVPRNITPLDWHLWSIRGARLSEDNEN